MREVAVGPPGHQADRVRELPFLDELRGSRTTAAHGPSSPSQLGPEIEAIRLSSGRWALTCNDTAHGRHSLVVLLSDDEGTT